MQDLRINQLNHIVEKLGKDMMPKIQIYTGNILNKKIFMYIFWIEQLKKNLILNQLNNSY